MSEHIPGSSLLAHRSKWRKGNGVRSFYFMPCGGLVCSIMRHGVNKGVCVWLCDRPCLFYCLAGLMQSSHLVQLLYLTRSSTCLHSRASTWGEFQHSTTWLSPETLQYQSNSLGIAFPVHFNALIDRRCFWAVFLQKVLGYQASLCSQWQLQRNWRWWDNCNCWGITTHTPTQQPLALVNGSFAEQAAQSLDPLLNKLPNRVILHANPSKLLIFVAYLTAYIKDLISCVPFRQS